MYTFAVMLSEDPLVNYVHMQYDQDIVHTCLTYLDYTFSSQGKLCKGNVYVVSSYKYSY